jgi:hypothetical protein
MAYADFEITIVVAPDGARIERRCDAPEDAMRVAEVVARGLAARIAIAGRVRDVALVGPGAANSSALKS